MLPLNVFINDFKLVSSMETTFFIVDLFVTAPLSNIPDNVYIRLYIIVTKVQKSIIILK